MRRLARLLSFLGAAAVVFGLSKVHAAYVADPPYDFTGSFRFAWAIGYVLLLWIAGYGFGLPELPRSARSAASVAAGVSASAAVGVSLLQLLVGDALLPRFVVLGSALLLVPWQVAVNALARGGRLRGEGRDRVVLVSTPLEVERLRADLQLIPERPAALVGHLEPAAAVEGGGVRPLIDLVLGEQASVVVLDREALSVDDVVAQAAALHEAGVRVRTLLQFYEEWLGKLPVGELERASLFFDISEVHRARYARVKRMVDVAVGVVGAVVLLVAIPLVALANLLGNRGPLWYRQERVGQGGEPFSILKFRTMSPGRGAVPADGAGASEWTALDDPRVTPFGKVLRASHLDELPQVLNILRGDLSVVGPRPEQPRYVRQLSETLPFYGMRHLVRPGLTGWAQVKYGYAGDEDDSLEKLQYEFFYLRHQSLRFDLRVIGRTVRSVAGTEGRGR